MKEEKLHSMFKLLDKMNEPMDSETKMFKLKLCKQQEDKKFILKTSDLGVLYESESCHNIKRILISLQMNRRLTELAAELHYFGLSDITVTPLIALQDCEKIWPKFIIELPVETDRGMRTVAIGGPKKKNTAHSYAEAFMLMKRVARVIIQKQIDEGLLTEQ